MQANDKNPDEEAVRKRLIESGKLVEQKPILVGFRNVSQAEQDEMREQMKNAKTFEIPLTKQPHTVFSFNEKGGLHQHTPEWICPHCGKTIKAILE